jgi:TPR repeat protein
MRSSLSPGVVGLSLAAVVLGTACTPNPQSLAARCDTGDKSACAEAKAKLQHQCELGHADACHFLAEVYAAGKGGPKDPAKAKEFFDAACERGLKTACGRTASRPPVAAAPGPRPALAPDASVTVAAPPAPDPSAAAQAPVAEKPAADAGAAERPEAPKPVKRASGPSQATLQRRCEQNDEAACMALGRQMIQAEARKNPAAARELLNQVKQACTDGDPEACDLIKKGLRGAR